MFYIGVLVAAVGCLFVVLGAAHVIADTILYFRSRTSVTTRGFAADDINAVAALVTAIGKLPPFALMIVIGVILLAVGERLMSGLQIFSY